MMFDSDGYVLSSSCPISCSLVTFASRVGGILDPNFLLHCRIVDQDLQKKIDQLKQIPLNYESSHPMSYPYQEEMFLDMDTLNHKQFHDPWEFQKYNPWLTNQCVWNTEYYPEEDLIIDAF